MPFQTIINTQPAPAVAGDFASANPRNFYPAGPGGLVAGPAGLVVGNFAWVSSAAIDPDSGPIIANSFGSGPVTGFVHRRQQGLITNFLADSSMVIPGGFMCDLLTAGDIWIKNSGSSIATPGMFAYANYATGVATFAAASAASTSTSTTFSISAQTFSTTASVNGNILTVTAVGSGSIYPGSVLSSTAASATILSQLTSTAALGALGGTGTYSLSVPEQTVASTTITGTYGLLTLGGTVTGNFSLGETLTGTSVPTGATITANASNGVSLTGAGAAGTYVTLTGTASSGTITGASNVVTKWFANSAGLTGEVIRCSSQVLG